VIVKQQEVLAERRAKKREILIQMSEAIQEEAQEDAHNTSIMSNKPPKEEIKEV
jgi:hypothetical protein